MAEIKFEDINLTSVVENSNIIVIAEKIEPHEFDDSIEEIEEGKVLKHVRKIYHFHIKEILKNTALEFFGDEPSFIELGEDDIAVYEAYQNNKLSIAKKAFFKGIEEDATFDKYNSAPDYNKEQLILFLLHVEDKHFQFTCEGSFEDVSKREEVKALIDEDKNDS